MMLMDKNLKTILVAPIILAFANDFISSGYMLFHLIRKKYSIKKVLLGRNTLIIVAAALLGGPIGMSCYLIAIQYIGVGYAAAISASYPALGALMAFVFIKDKLSKMGVCGILLSVIATMLLGYSASTNSSFCWIGFTFALVCALSWGLEVIISSYGMKKSIPPYFAYFIRQVSASLGYLTLFVMIIPLDNIKECYAMTSKIMPHIFMISLITTVSYLYYYRAINIIGPVRAMGLNITYAVWAILLGWFLLSNQINFQLIILCCFIILGSFLTIISPEKSSKLLRYNK
ncbi:hypothetical protein CCS41_00610 [Candidatus Fukatsuia symbiotica]|uniref:EamA domain-containing protein n=2 Tax=Yersiniaceae TaxID=1903411 RepID=A0A2U8I2K2_9GAMM|nr:hypothetical protein CCS41_00610 [Candidatus Fukatsuia symbiotica]